MMWARATCGIFEQSVVNVSLWMQFKADFGVRGGITQQGSLQDDSWKQTKNALTTTNNLNKILNISNMYVTNNNDEDDNNRICKAHVLMLTRWYICGTHLHKDNNLVNVRLHQRGKKEQLTAIAFAELLLTLRSSTALIRHSSPPHLEQNQRPCSPGMLGRFQILFYFFLLFVACPFRWHNHFL